MYNVINYKTNKEYIDFTALSPELSDFSRAVLFNRLKDNYPKYKDYIYNYYGLHKDIDKLKDVDKASMLINKHLDNPDTHFAVVCDYDSDGINSGVVQYLMLTTVFKVKEENISVFVNKRKTGNGFSKTLVKRILDRNEERHIDIMISSDHGSANEASFKIFKEHNIDMAITDHHEIDYSNYPHSATVFINNQREDSEYSKNVSGCFVVFLVLMKTYMDRFKTNDVLPLRHIFPYVAITTITDVMSLNDPINRLVIRLGLNSMNSYRDKFWLFLASSIGINKRYVSKHMGFNIGPVINAANRTDSEQTAFDLLTSIDSKDLTINLNSLLTLNKYRKSTQRELVAEMKKKIDFSKYKHSIVFILDTDIAINGNVASSLGESYKLPTICFSGDGDILKGSCRGILNSIHMLDILDEIIAIDKDVIIERGGHKNAAGLSIHKDKFERFKELFDLKCEEAINSTNKELLDIDMEIREFDTLYKLIDNINSLAPYGKDFKEPVFLGKFRLKKAYVNKGMARLIFKDTKNNTMIAKHFYRTQTMEELQSLGEDIDVEVIFNFNLSTYGNVNEYVMEIINICKKEL